MGSGIYALADQLLAQVRVPVVLYLIVRTPWDPPSYQRPPIHTYNSLIQTLDLNSETLTLEINK